MLLILHKLYIYRRVNQATSQIQSRRDDFKRLAFMQSAKLAVDLKFIATTTVSLENDVSLFALDLWTIRREPSQGLVSLSLAGISRLHIFVVVFDLFYMYVKLN